MNRVSLYHRLPVALQNTALSIYGLRLRRIRYGGVHKHALAQLLESSSYTREEWWSQQQESLVAIMRHAATHVPHYRSKSLPMPSGAHEAVMALGEWPVLEKSEVQAAGTSMIAGAGWSGRRYEIHTGGTTGRALCVYTNAKALQENYAFYERQKRWAGVAADARVATFAGRTIVPVASTYGPYWRRNLAANQLLMSSYHLSSRTIDDYIDTLADFGPALIDSYPSSLEPIARRIVNRGDHPVRPVAVITSSETLFPEVRGLLTAAFGCKVFDHYGSAEMAAFVTQCSHGGYHANPEFGFLELLDADGRPVPPGVDGEVVATGFINPVMPLIRYRLGDMARWAVAPCPCGSSFPGIEAIAGRVDDVIITPTGRRVGRLDPIFKAVGSLHEARIIQIAPHKVRMELVVTQAFSAEDESNLVNELKARIGNEMVIEVLKCGSLPRTVGGKLRSVVSLKSWQAEQSQIGGED